MDQVENGHHHHHHSHDANGNRPNGLPRVSSNRFQVCRTEGEEEPLLAMDNKCPSEPPPSLLPPPPPYTERKMSTGRFTVGQSTHSSIEPDSPPRDNGSMENVEADEGEQSLDEDNDPERTGSLMSNQKTVQFALAERNEPCRRSSELDSNGTINQKSWRNMKTLEHPPIIDFYRQSIDQDGLVTSRPSMAQLIHGQKSIPEDMELENFEVHDHLLNEKERSASKDLKEGELDASRLEKFVAPVGAPRTKFGWVQGVFVRCLLNIFGVMLYLRVSWVAGQAGVLYGSAVVLLASLVTTITALSTCAICTNGDVKGGGAYFLISRSLGPEFGGSIGLIFCVANAVGAAMYVVGFAETIRDLFKVYDLKIIDGDMNDVRVVGIVTCLLLLAIVFIGTEFESKMQQGLLVVLSVSIVDYMIGAVMPTSEADQMKGLTGLSLLTLRSNLLPVWRQNETFFSVFSVYFPAATGIMAGANISGDLANPQQAIPLGTLLAILVTTVIYLLVVWATGASCVKDATGLALPLFDNFTGSFIAPDCALNDTCEYGLLNYFQVVEMSSLWGPLITAGIFAATLSSALASMVSAPKVFQAVCKDRLFPKIDIFAKGYGPNEEPKRAYLLAGAVAVLMVLIGDLNAIAPIISNFFLASYALLNYACFDQSFADSPGFRPSFKYYNKWVSLVGSIMCIFVMFIISWWTALVTFLFFAMLFLYLLHRKPDVNWGSSTQAHSYKNALASMVKLWNTEEHVKNYRPQILVLTGNPAARPSLVDFAYNITKGTSLMICGYVVPYAPCDRVYAVCRKLDRQLNDWLRRKRVKSFYSSVASTSLRTGAQALLQTTGLGRLRPNIVIIGFKANWCEGGPTECKIKEIADYFGVIEDAFENGMGVAVLRNQMSGLDYSDAMKRYNMRESAKLQLPDVGKTTVKTMSADQTVVKVEENEKAKGVVEGEEKAAIAMEAKDTAEVVDETKETLEVASARSGSFRVLDSFVAKNQQCIAASTSLADSFPFDFDLSDDEAEEEEEELEEEEVEESGDETLTKGTDRPDVERGRASTKRGMSFSANLRRRKRKAKRRESTQDDSRRPTQEQRALMSSISRFQRKIKKGVIDVWWLYDDGGLTLLIPHLLTVPKSFLEGAKLRVFTISTSSRTMEQEQRNMASLLSKFRIDFSDVFVIADIGKKPSARTLDSFNQMIEPFKGVEGDDSSSILITDSELSAQREKTNRQLRLGELLREHSAEADLVVVTLPVPRKGLVSSCLYLAWLDMMTRGLPPTLLIRGNQTSVLTFYS